MEEARLVRTRFLWPATSNMAAALGLKAVFADVDVKTRQIDPASVERKITKRTRVDMRRERYPENGIMMTSAIK